MSLGQPEYASPQYHAAACFTQEGDDTLHAGWNVDV